MAVADQPVSHVQWVPRERLHGNQYNPNHVAPPELKLLKLSILEDGWTQPIVVHPHGDLEGDFEVVDGFHRYLVSDDPEVWALTEGLVPIVPITPDEAQRRMSTIRHNRARGTHRVLAMADIVEYLISDLQLDPQEVGTRLGMDQEEVGRLLERGDMRKRASSDEFGEAWRPAPREPDA